MKNILEIFSTEEYERKLLLKHNVEMYEVEEVIVDDAPKHRFIEKGIREGEDKYMVLGQTIDLKKKKTGKKKLSEKEKAWKISKK